MALVILALSLWLASAMAVSAQVVPTEPISAANGRVIVGAEITGTYASEDPGFFNYTDYEYSGLRNLRIGLTAEVRATRRIQFLGELRLDHWDHLQPFALYVRLRPWPERRFDVQAGRIPTTFGAFGRGGYGTANLLIGVPLAYQYLTSIRADALPASADDLLQMRARGWLSTFPLGRLEADRGLPIINTVRADTGVQVHGVNGMFEWTGAITTGSLSNPRVSDDNDGRQIAGRIVARPVAALAIGASVARGAFLNRVIEESLPDVRAEDGVQRVIGVDAEYSEGRFLVRGEVIHAQWRLPNQLRDTNERDLGARSVMAETRYRIYPGVQVAARIERLAFSTLRLGNTRQAWEAPVRRLELGGSYSFTRNVTFKGSWQRNVRDGGRILEDNLLATQIVYWF